MLMNRQKIAKVIIIGIQDARMHNVHAQFCGVWTFYEVVAKKWLWKELLKIHCLDLICIFFCHNLVRCPNTRKFSHTTRASWMSKYFSFFFFLNFSAALTEFSVHRREMTLVSYSNYAVFHAHSHANMQKCKRCRWKRQTPPYHTDSPKPEKAAFCVPSDAFFSWVVHLTRK